MGASVRPAGAGEHQNPTTNANKGAGAVVKLSIYLAGEFVAVAALCITLGADHWLVVATVPVWAAGAVYLTLTALRGDDKAAQPEPLQLRHVRVLNTRTMQPGLLVAFRPDRKALVRYESDFRPVLEPRTDLEFAGFATINVDGR